jgi:hypothetical protein
MNTVNQKAKSLNIGDLFVELRSGAIGKMISRLNGFFITVEWVKGDKPKKQQRLHCTVEIKIIERDRDE